MSQKSTIRSVEGLAAANLVDAHQMSDLQAVAEKYAVAVTPYLMNILENHDPSSPVARQYIPSIEELKTQPEELEDPIGDEAHSPVKGIVHRYPDRVLLKPLHACAVYCQFCFRREMVGPWGEALNPEELTSAIDYIRQNPAIWEVILTGGDPLLLSPRRLKEIISSLDSIPHVQVIRVHTRIPVADPDRITSETIEALKTSDSAVWVGVHVNHVQELTSTACQSLAKLADAGIPLVSQIVLLQGMNGYDRSAGSSFSSFSASQSQALLPTSC